MKTEKVTPQDRLAKAKKASPSVLIAGGLALATGLWMASGQFSDAQNTTPPSGQTAAEAATTNPAAKAETAAVAVRVRDSKAEPYQAFIRITGKTEADRRATIKAETEGRVVERPVDLGQLVVQGDVLARLAEDDRPARLSEAQALVQQRQTEFNAASKLAKKGFQSEVNRMQARAQLEAAQAQLKRIRVDLDKTTIEAPFAGVVQRVDLDVGDFVKIGEPLIHLIDLDPMLVSIQVAEREVEQVEEGGSARVRLLSGQDVMGTVRRIAPSASQATRTFHVEIALPNASGALRDGVTANVELPMQPVMAHRISPSVLTLNDAGLVGVRAVGRDDEVIFYPVDIVADGADEMWIEGIPPRITLITVGQEYVREGARVKPVYDESAQKSEGGAS